jgi:1,4-alpha-glucan branching enzyme
MIGRMPGDAWQKFAGLRNLYGYLWAYPGKKLLFMGGEFGQWNEWNYNDSLQWHLLQWESHQGLQKCVRDLNHLYTREPALHQVDFDGHGFEWIDCHNWEESTLAFIRKAKDPKDYVIALCNFTPDPRMTHRLGVQELVWYDEIYSSDSSFYGGSNLGNFPGRQAEERPWHGRPYSIEITVPPLGMVMFKPKR